MTESVRFPPRLEQHLCFGLYATSMAITRAYKPILDELGITFPQYLALTVLWERDGETIGQIAKRLELEPSTITPLTKRLEAIGLVSRRRSTADERIVTVHLTAKGSALRGRAVCLGQRLLELIGKPNEEVSEMVERTHEFRRRIAAG